MDFCNPKELRFFNDLRPIPGFEAFWRGGGGGGGGMSLQTLWHA